MSYSRYDGSMFINIMVINNMVDCVCISFHFMLLCFIYVKAEGEATLLLVLLILRLLILCLVILCVLILFLLIVFLCPLCQSRGRGHLIIMCIDTVCVDIIVNNLMCTNVACIKVSFLNHICLSILFY